MKMTLEILIKVINEYRTEGAELMGRLGQKYGYDITLKEQFDELIWKSNPNVPRSGNLSKKINYSFHGGECGFHNRKTQQNIEVILTNAPKFGKIDAWFLMEYINSTAEYKHLTKDIKWTELNPMLKELYRTGEIEEI